MKVFGWAADYSGCGFYRIGLPLDALKAHGWDTVASAMFPMKDRDEIDVIVGQRVCIERASFSWRQFRQEGRKLVFEVDDDLLNVHPDNENAYHFFSQPEVRRRLMQNMAMADLVTVTNEHLAEQVRQFNDNVAVLPNCVPMSLLDHERPKRDRTTIGWAGSATHLPDFMLAAKHIKKVLDQRPDTEMHFIGTDYSRLIKHESRYTPWVQDVVEHIKTMDFDIGIAPLAPDIFNRSKSYLKALEYASVGIPVVASDYGPYREFVRHGETGFLVKHDHEWTTYLRQLIDDKGLRLRMGQAARELAAEHTIEKNAWKWDDAYRSVLSR